MTDPNEPGPNFVAPVMALESIEAEPEPEPLVHGINFFDDEIGCDQVLEEPFLIALFDTDKITCPDCRRKLIRGG